MLIDFVGNPSKGMFHTAHVHQIHFKKFLNHLNAQWIYINKTILLKCECSQHLKGGMFFF